MALFDAKNFNGEVFGAYVDAVENLNRNELLKSGALVEKKQYAPMLPDQSGGNYIMVPIKARIGGETSNYDGNTDIDAVSRKTYTHGRIVIGRAQGWTEKDFSADVTGEDFLPAAEEMAEFWDDVDQNTLLSTLKGIFGMTGKANLEFVNGHTYDVSGDADVNVFTETTLNTGVQKALGDHKGKFKMVIMHSVVATNVENLKLMSHMRYTDKDGVEKDLTLYTLNGRLVLVDDNMPTAQLEAKYVRCCATIKGALLVRESNAEAVNAEVNLTDVESDIPEIAAGEYVKLLPAATAYTSYVLGEGAIEYTNVGAKKPYSMSEDDKKNGGETTLWSRQRKIFSPYGISFKNTGIISPTAEQLEDGKNWTLANSNEENSPEYFPHKAIAIARIITRG